MTSELSGWGSFYVIVATSAGALIGLQFVVMTLIAQRPPVRAGDAAPVFFTPTIVHFGVVLLLSALASAPWRTIDVFAWLWGAAGLGGVAYMASVTRRLANQPDYRPGVEDWAFYAALPFIAYALLALSSLAAQTAMRPALFTLGGTTLLLLFIGIHNAWDTIVYHVFVILPDRKADVRANETNDIEKL